MANNGNSDGDWKYWAIRLGFGTIMVLLPVTLALVALSYTNLKDGIGRMEASLDKHTRVQEQVADRQEKKFDELCKRVGDQGVLLKEHDILLRQPWQQRKEFYQFKTKDNWSVP